MRALLVFILLALPTTAHAEESAWPKTVALDDLTATVWLWPGVFTPTSLEVHLADASGAPPTDVTRLDVAFAMIGMNHGARGITADPVELGTYQAAGYLLAMSGPWWMDLRAERADGRLASARLAFDAPPDTSGVANAMYTRPDQGVQVEDVAAYPDGVLPDRITVAAGRPVRLEVAFVDDPPCGPAVQVDDGTAGAVSADGLAEVTFTPVADGPVRLACAPEGLLVARAP